MLWRASSSEFRMFRFRTTQSRRGNALKGLSKIVDVESSPSIGSVFSVHRQSNRATSSTSNPPNTTVDRITSNLRAETQQVPSDMFSHIYLICAFGVFTTISFFGVVWDGVQVTRNWSPFTQQPPQKNEALPVGDTTTSIDDQ